MKQDLLTIKRSLLKQIEKIDKLLEDEKPAFEKLPQSEQVEYILYGVADFWDIGLKDLLKKTRVMASKRNYAAILLRDYTDLTNADIARELRYTNHSTAWTNIDKMDDKLSNKVYGDSRVRAIYENLIDYLELPPSKYYRK